MPELGSIPGGVLVDEGPGTSNKPLSKPLTPLKPLIGNNNSSSLPKTGTTTGIFQLGIISTLAGAILKFKK